MNAGCVYQFSMAAVVSSICCGVQAAPELEPLSDVQQVAVQNFCESLASLSKALEACTPALVSVQDAAAAAAVVPLVQQVIQSEASVKAAAEKVCSSGVDVERFYRVGGLEAMLSSVPLAAYNEALRKVLAAGCYGSLSLYAAVMEQNPGKEVPLSREDKEVLQQVEVLILQLKEIAPVSHWRPLETEFIRKYDALLPAVRRLQQNPHGAMQLRRILEQNKDTLNELCNHQFHSNGDMEERFLVQPDHFLGAYYSARGLAEYFHQRLFLWNDSLARQYGDAVWKSAEPQLALVRQKYALGAGDGRTPETAFDIPGEVKPADYVDFANEVTQAIFGSRYLPGEPRHSSLTRTGRLVICGLVNVGRSGDKNNYNDPVLVMPCYFYADAGKEVQK